MSKPGRSAEASQRGGAEERLLGGRLAGLSLPRQVAILAVWPLLEQVMLSLSLSSDYILGRLLSPDYQELQPRRLCLHISKARYFHVNDPAACCIYQIIFGRN